MRATGAYEGAVAKTTIRAITEAIVSAKRYVRANDGLTRKVAHSIFDAPTEI